MNQLFKSLFLLALTAITIFLCQKFPNAATDPKTGLELILPAEIPGHASFDREISDLEKEWLPSDTGRSVEFLRLLFSAAVISAPSIAQKFASSHKGGRLKIRRSKRLKSMEEP